ncbi:MAG: hemolysin III family protein [Pirellulales bacterium]|nr:hemolysin III family protein [Pirellulales bacterium]
MATLDDCPIAQAPDAPFRVSPEVVNASTHAVGLVLSLAGSLVLLAAAGRSGDAWHIAGAIVYSATMIGVYAASTLSHAVQHPRWRHVFRRLDQAAIYLFIAGTYTPFALGYLRAGPWWVLFGVVWGIALVGAFLKTAYGHRVDAVTTWFYVLLGWLPGVAAWPLVGVVQPPGLRWMLYGGLCYTLGTLFLHLDRRVPLLHGVWHVAVLAGTAWHYFAILFCVVPLN